MNNNQNNTAEIKGTKKRRKKSLYRSQMRFLSILIVLTIVMGVGAGFAVNYFMQEDGIIDTYIENGEEYYSKLDKNGFYVTDKNGDPVDTFLINEKGIVSEIETDKTTRVYATAMGSWLQLTKSGKINTYAKVDMNGEYDGSDKYGVLIFPRVSQENIASIRIHHKNADGSLTDFTLMGIDALNEDGEAGSDGKNDTFDIVGYENTVVNQLKAAAISRFAGSTLTMKKLLTSVMEEIDNKKTDADGDYLPLIDENGKIRFDEYGLGDDAAYYELTDTDGKRHRVYIGDKCPDGQGLYVRYEGDCDTNGEARQAVYKISEDSGISGYIGVDVSRSFLFLGSPETLVYPQITYFETSTSYFMPENFTVYKNKDGEFSKVIDFSYTDLSGRNYTIDQYDVYKINDKNLLPGYILDSDLANKALYDIYEMSMILSSDYQDVAAKNHVNVRQLVKRVVTFDEVFDLADFSDVMGIIDNAVSQDAEIAEILKEYGLYSPEYKLYYNSTEYNSYGNLEPVFPNYIWVSEKTPNNTRYVWAPMYQQILEIGFQYLDDIFEKETEDWAAKDLFRMPIYYCSSIRINGVDLTTDSQGYGTYHDILFEILNSYKLTSQKQYDSKYQIAEQYGAVIGKFNTVTGVNTDGYIDRLTLSINVSYKVKYVDEKGEQQESELTHTYALLNNVYLDTIRNYCRYVADRSYADTLSDAELNAMRNYSETVKNYSISGNTVTVSHLVTDASDQYGYLSQVVTGANGSYNVVNHTNYALNFVYNVATGKLSLRAGQEGRVISEVFNETVVENFVKLKVKNDGEAPKLSEYELDAVNNYHKQMSGIKSNIELLRITRFDKSGGIIARNEYSYNENDSENKTEGNRYIYSFRTLYQTILQARYIGKAGEASTVTDVFLTEEQMKAFEEKGDDCEIKMTIKLQLDGIENVYRTYNYGATKSFVTVNGDGIFYILRNRSEKFLNDAIKASNGDGDIVPDGAY